MAALLINDDERAAIQRLREAAAAMPVAMPGLGARIATVDGKAVHMRQMTAQTIELPVGWLCTFSIETGHPCGAARHLSVSRQGVAPGTGPHPAMIAEIAHEFGFTGTLSDWVCWPEQLQGRDGIAVNVVQPIDAPASETRN
jgi:hypothetical protein